MVEVRDAREDRDTQAARAHDRPDRGGAHVDDQHVLDAAEDDRCRKRNLHLPEPLASTHTHPDRGVDGRSRHRAHACDNVEHHR